MSQHVIYPSLTRIAHFENLAYSHSPCPREEWANGDYVMTRVINPGGVGILVELMSGRMIKVMYGDLIIGALGIRHATLEATGTWEKISDDGRMHALTGAGLVGKLTSKSVFIPDMIELQYLGHIYLKGRKSNMSDFVPEIEKRDFSIPTLLLVGTSMSAGKTTSARISTRIFKEEGLSVVNAKLTGAGRYQDILTVRDAGADYSLDFVDAGLPSSVCSPVVYKKVLSKLLSGIAKTDADIAVIEVGASPLEPYNGDLAIEAIRKYVKCTILCASDPYAALGIMKSYQLKPSVTTGASTNTLAGIEMIEKLCHVKALNIIDPETHNDLKQVLRNKFQLW